LIYDLSTFLNYHSFIQEIQKYFILVHQTIMNATFIHTHYTNIMKQFYLQTYQPNISSTS